MSDISLQDYITTVRSSGLIPVDQLREHYKSFRQSTDSDSDRRTSQQFATFLENHAGLTIWQNEKLLRGKYRGLKLGKFRILQLLGIGGMGRVFLAEDEILQRRVAVKILPSELSEKPDSLQRFYLEARALARLDHHNIVRVHDVASEGTRHFIVMEYVEGLNLYKKIRQEGPATALDALGYVRQTAEGLQHAHDAALIHRDIKPPNLLLDSRGVVKILDLGLAKWTSENSENVETAPGKTVGTADFISPEQINKRMTVDHRADLYSLGCSLFFWLTGRPPFASGSVADRLRAHRVELPPAINPSRIKAKLPPISTDLAILCGRMLAKDPAERFASAKELIQHVDQVIEIERAPREIPEVDTTVSSWDDPFWDE